MPDSLGDRMKEYENVFRYYLPKKLPIIIRVDGRAFHTFTKGFKRPFDELLFSAMRDTAKALCEAVEGIKMAYMQSDEISLLLTNNDTIETQPWFDNNLQKLVSISSAIATLSFNNAFRDHYHDYIDCDEEMENWKTYCNACDKALFDSRAFVLPENEVVNYFIWRQQDATRNSIQMVARSLYSHKQLVNKNSSQLQDMIHEKGQNWNDYPDYYKRGLAFIKKPVTIKLDNQEITRNKFVPDYKTPIFTQDRSYIENTFKYKGE